MAALVSLAPDPMPSPQPTDGAGYQPTQWQCLAQYATPTPTSTATDAPAPPPVYSGQTCAVSLWDNSTTAVAVPQWQVMLVGLALVVFMAAALLVAKFGGRGD